MLQQHLNEVSALSELGLIRWFTGLDVTSRTKQQRGELDAEFRSIHASGVLINHLKQANQLTQGRPAQRRQTIHSGDNMFTHRDI